MYFTWQVYFYFRTKMLYEGINFQFRISDIAQSTEMCFYRWKAFPDPQEHKLGEAQLEAQLYLKLLHAR